MFNEMVTQSKSWYVLVQNGQYSYHDYVYTMIATDCVYYASNTMQYLLKTNTLKSHYQELIAKIYILTSWLTFRWIIWNFSL